MNDKIEQLQQYTVLKVMSMCCLSKSSYALYSSFTQREQFVASPWCTGIASILYFEAIVNYNEGYLQTGTVAPQQSI